MLILLVDDDKDDRDVFLDALKEIYPNEKCLTANNGEEALKMLCYDLVMLPDIVFMDINMPFMNGKKCLSRMRQFGKLQHIPVVIYSTTIMQADKDELSTLGAEFFVKPSTFKNLKETLSSILTRVIGVYPTE